MEMKPNEMVEAFWNNWTQSLSLLSTAGKQVEQLTVDSFKQQQDAIEKIRESMDNVEKEWKQVTLQMQTQYSDYVSGIAGTSYAEQVQQWQEKWNELSDQVQSMTLAPTKTSLSLLSQASSQLEEFYTQWISQQQQQRDAAQEQIESFFKDLQAMQLDTMKKFEENTSKLMPTV
ncbi:polyhydroxyalkanoic acid inclusion protein PhaP [Ectobacillus polymachus]|uniref:polyhydroxyalkanoic acid inclusion protein PhaP n=1 Tax=Ectobacillus polymachus TaxID=1508806 RepID=UPI003A89D1D2